MMKYFIIVICMGALGLGIIVQAGRIMFVKRGYWMEVAERFRKENVPIKPNRGNIISADGKLMASSLPEYKIYMDFEANKGTRDSLVKYMNEICNGLHKIFPDKSAAEFKAHLRKGMRQHKGRRSYLIYPHRITYIQYKEAKSLPVFRLHQYTGGFYAQKFNQRKKPFGSLASRTLGSLYADTAQIAKNGIELRFDSLLRGKEGVIHRQKVMNHWLDITDIPSIDGCDILTTIDVDMQDICEKALIDKLTEIHANVGVAILMEVETGDVKAIVNMSKGHDGKFYEQKNHAISDLMEPGSTFKTASMMVALEDGYIDPHYVVDTGKGVKDMYGRKMRDWNWHHNGFGIIDATRILEVSSNVGVASIIEEFYHNNPQKFVDGIKRLGLDTPLHLQIPGGGDPIIKGPKQRSYFPKTSLPWMSIGYETQIPPMNILAFYNAIANDGKMVRPRFVTAALMDGKVVEKYPVVTIKEKICSDHTLKDIKQMLRCVVRDGLAKQAGSKQFAVSGKTGTAQISKGAAGYKTGKTDYLVSFCGFFPSEKPKYSCIVSIQKTGLPASGGQMAGSVFGKIAERVYAKDLCLRLDNAKDTVYAHAPHVKRGELNDTYSILEELNIKNQRLSILNEEQECWGKAITNEGDDEIIIESDEMHNKLMPDVRGMGARDAVYLLEKRGLKVTVSGVGKVRRQSLPHGRRIIPGQTVALVLTL